MLNNKKKTSFFLLLVILIIASFLRVWELEKIPPGLYPDAAIYANEGFLSLKNKDFKVFYPENYGREGLFMWLLALFFYLFGVSIWSARFTTALIGILTVLGTYLLSKEIFRDLRYSYLTPLLSSFFLAVSFWHVNFSRLGFRVILLPFVLVFAFYFLLKGFKQKSIFNSILGGLFFGLGFYTYTSFRMAILILPVFLLFWWLYKKEEKKKFFLVVLFFLITTFSVALPIGIYFLKNPEYFISRATPITIFNAENPIKEFIKSFLLHIGMFNFYGDRNWRHNFSGHPMLFWPIGILFLIGLFLSFKHSLKFKESPQFAISNLFLIVWFFSMLLPGILTREGVPHSLRVAGTIPVVFIFAGIGGTFLFEQFKNKIKKEKILISFSFLFLFFCLFFDFYKYFFLWANRIEVKSEFTRELLEMGNYLNSLPEEVEKYVIVNRGGIPISWANNLPIPSQTLMFLENSKYGKTRSIYLLPENLKEIKIKNKGIVLFLRNDEKLLNELLKMYPNGFLSSENDFWVFKINY